MYNPQRSTHDPQKLYPPHADLPYMQSLSRSGLLEPRIETTLQVRLNSYLFGGAFPCLPRQTLSRTVERSNGTTYFAFGACQLRGTG